VVYLTLVLLLRAIPKRNAGSISPNDMLTLILIGGIGADAAMGGSTSVGDLLLMIGLVLAWGYLLDLLEFYFPSLGRLFRDRQTALIEDGRLLRRNMRREMVTEEELMTALRKEGVENLSVVRSACLEADGEISLVKKDGAEDK
jgi:uncharacterized membrane protein YcaP (DUF421 family)